ncbi:MAG: extracellular solute-binding protein [Patescibacteria group bacterium]|jgi:multiple sugar transport system substrate-binding protein
MFKKITILSLLTIFLMTSGFGCKIASQETQNAMKPITLVYWRVFDDSDAFQDIIAQYKAIHPNITIEYHKFRYEEYENQLLNALAEDRGPDIFSIQNTWVKKYQSKLAPMPATVTMVYPVTTGTIQKSTTYQLRTNNSLTVKDLKDNFVDVVGHDVILDDGKIYGLPLSLDTLAMFYNKDLLNNAGISQIPQYWNNEFLQDVKKLTIQDPKNGLIQAGVALGGSTNINRFSDILSVLMIQNGAIMMDDAGRVQFNLPAAGQANNGYNPGIEALRFYTDFSNSAKESYSWNDSLPNSLDMFINGNLAIMFDYSYNLATIRARAPKLNFSIVKLPQIEGNPPTNINFANYWIEGVSKKSTNQNEAWDFIQFMTKAESVKGYLQKTNHPTALRALIDWQKKQNNEISVFVDEVLTAKSWYKGKNEQAAEDAIKEMINEAKKNLTEDFESIISTTASKIQQTIN